MTRRKRTREREFGPQEGGLKIGQWPLAIVLLGAWATAANGAGVNGPAAGRPVSSPAGNSAVNRGVINGTGMVRPGSGPGTVGGPAKAGAGINGSSIRPKH